MELFKSRRAATIEWRAKMAEALLAGKKDVSDFVEATGCSPGTCRAFANCLVDEGKLKRTYHPAYRPPVCFVPRCAAHNEYEPTASGRAWLEAELARARSRLGDATSR